MPDTTTTEGHPMSTKRGSIDCHSCGAPRRFEDDMSCTGKCSACGEYLLVENLRGLVDPQSVPYKRWRIAFKMRRPGRPRNTTPPPEWFEKWETRQPALFLPDHS